MTKRRPSHRMKVSRRNLYGARRWWATCTCTWVQGCHDRNEAARLAGEHLVRLLPDLPPKETPDA